MHCIYGAHLEFFFFLLCFSRSHRLRGRNVITAFTGVLSCMEVIKHKSRGLFLLTTLICTADIPRAFYRFANAWCHMGFSFFFRLAFQDISGWVFHARKVHQKKGFVLSSISALRLLLQSMFDGRKRITLFHYSQLSSEIVMFFFFLCDTWYHTFIMSCNSSDTDLRARATTCTLPDDS